MQYNWPSWLNAQSEKQRLIWGYKILFLDVLFPLDVKKIIFVDADQVVRTDLKELLEVDLEGAVYGYTPFCDSRKEMDGFRFWNSGYWKEHLAGRPYHISALYVVDLVRFRQFAAGDRLRGQCVFLHFFYWSFLPVVSSPYGLVVCVVSSPPLSLSIGHLF